ncbi:DMT family transporter [Mesorhizobium sp. WSM4303]|uniref:DMT family transporter n=1 Tax=unclassified Mesorhizobium TaxID=325217 RepID=UPI00115C82E0|nr:MULTISPECIES: DMT family transporter [unclassified Mesorhizobium]TRC95398.1 DMT family transporter [Mesorhizobium sp. WSM4306]TRD08918.1 DMT family transporter [Mesorhizobium sp. WSM4303]
MAEDRNTKPAILAGLVMIGIYAVQFVAARFSLREHLAATDLTTLRFIGAGMVMLPVVWRSGLAAIKTLGWRRALTLAALAGLPYPIIINWGLTYAPAAHGAALCPASIVFFSFVLSHMATTDKASRQRTIGVAAIIAGLILFIAPVRPDSGMKDVFFGDLLFIASGAMFAAYAVLVRRWRVEPVTATATVVLLSCVPVPLLYFFAPSGLRAASVAEIASQIVIQGFLAGAAAMFLYTYVVRQLGSQTASLFMPCVPIATVLIAMTVLGETPTGTQFAAIVIMAAGMAFSAVARPAAKTA